MLSFSEKRLKLYGKMRFIGYLWIFVFPSAKIGVDRAYLPISAVTLLGMENEDNVVELEIKPRPDPLPAWLGPLFHTAPGADRLETHREGVERGSLRRSTGSQSPS